MASKRADRLWAAVGEGGKSRLVWTTWATLAGDDLPVLRRFLDRSPGRASTWPCRRVGDGCVRVIRRTEAGFRAVCGDREHGCESEQVMEQQLVLWRLNFNKLWLEVCEALGLLAAPAGADEHPPPARWAHVDKAASTPVHFSVTHDRDTAEAVFKELVGEHKEDVVLLVPSFAGWNPALVDRARGRGVRVEALTDLVWREGQSLAAARLLGEAGAPVSRAATRSGAVVRRVQLKRNVVLRLEYAGESTDIKGNRAADLLKHLLLHPGAEFDYGELVARFLAVPSDLTGTENEEGLDRERGLGPTMSTDDLVRLRQDVRRLKDRLAELSGRERERVLAEIAKTEAFLAKDLDVHLRPRRMSEPTEKDSKRVRAALSRLINEVRQNHPALASHLDTSIQRRGGVQYAPQPPVEWSE